MKNEDDILQYVSEDFEFNNSINNSQENEKWKIIIADDDEEVHAVTNLALSGFTFQGKAINILSSFSTKETKKLILQNPDTAVIFLDVVMEDFDSGFQVVKFIREVANNNLVRIILRTGQPGYAPELEVITTFDINDYKEKTELTSSKLVTTLISSLRNYKDLKKIENNRKSLEIVAYASINLHGLDSEIPFSKSLYKHLISLMNSFQDEAKSQISIFNGILDNEEINIDGGCGKFSQLNGKINMRELIFKEDYEEFTKNKITHNIFFKNETCTICLKSQRGVHRIIHLDPIPPINEMKKNILKTFCQNISTVYNNIELLDEQKKVEIEIRQSLQEKKILLKELHHRVKNNLQIISSLLHMQGAGSKDKKILSILKESEDRVQSMSLVHEKLKQTDLMATIDFKEYLRSLAERLISSYSANNAITLKINSEELTLSVNKAIPCGLIVNEIITNSIKYAYPDNSKGIVQIDLHTNGSLLILKICDDGIGFPKEVNSPDFGSLGMKLIRILTEQINGELEINNNNGAFYSLSFTDSEERDL